MKKNFVQVISEFFYCIAAFCKEISALGNYTISAQVSAG